MTTQRGVGIAAAVTLVLVLGLLLALAPAAPAAAQNTACYRPAGGASFTCGDGGSFVLLSGATLDMRTGANATIGGSLVVTGNVDVVGNLEVVDHLANSGQTYFIPGDAVAVTDGAIITPTTTVVELTAAGTVGAEMGVASDGQLVTLINTVNQTITISETAGARMAGNFAMGQYDTITLMGNGVTWFEIARSNN
jgi:hypothetical protein